MSSLKNTLLQKKDIMRCLNKLDALKFLNEMRQPPIKISDRAKQEVYYYTQRKKGGFSKRIDAIINEVCREAGFLLFSRLEKEKISEEIDKKILSAIIKTRVTERNVPQRDIELIKEHIKNVVLKIMKEDNPKEIFSKIVMITSIEKANLAGFLSSK